MKWIKSEQLDGELCLLEPLSLSHQEQLEESVKDGELWRLWYTMIPEPHNIIEDIQKKLQLQKQGLLVPFAIVDKKTKQAVGMTSYLNIEQKHLRLEIGGTWNRKSVQKTGLNTEVKLLLLQYAFETLNCNVVEFRTHYFNSQSRKAIERLGAKLDGILRNHMIMPDGTLRDTCVYSILNNEWLTVKRHLRYLLIR